MTQSKLKQALNKHKDNLAELRLQSASHGIDVPIELKNSIDHELRQIADIQAELDTLESERPDGQNVDAQIAELWRKNAELSLEAAGHSSKIPARLEQKMAETRAEIARLNRLANPNARPAYRDFDARIEVLEHQMSEVQSLIALVLKRLNPTTRQRVISFSAFLFVFFALLQWVVPETRYYYLSNADTLAVGVLISLLALVVSALLYVVKRYANE